MRFNQGSKFANIFKVHLKHPKCFGTLEQHSPFLSNTPVITQRIFTGPARVERLWVNDIQPNDEILGPSVLVWGAVHHGDRSELVVVGAAMNRHRNIQILRNQMLPWATGVFGRNFVYVQDNAPPHTACDTAAFLDQQDVEVMDWPALSPDMNPIEHDWDQMSVWIRDMDVPHYAIAELNNVVRGLQFGQEGCRPWWRACLVVLGLFWPLEAGTHATSVGVRRAISC